MTYGNKLMNALPPFIIVVSSLLLVVLLLRGPVNVDSPASLLQHLSWLAMLASAGTDLAIGIASSAAPTSMRAYLMSVALSIAGVVFGVMLVFLTLLAGRRFIVFELCCLALPILHLVFSRWLRPNA